MKLPVVGRAHEAGPGEAAFTWFIYGSSLDAAAFAAWGREHGYAPPDLARGVPARLDGYRIAFDVRSRFWGGAVGTLAPAPGQTVEGLALPLPAAARALVEHKEGAISGLYEPFEVEVVPLAGSPPGPRIQAVAYRAAASRRLPAEETPAAAWIDAVVRGGRALGLSPGYLDALRAKAPPPPRPGP